MSSSFATPMLLEIEFSQMKCNFNKFSEFRESDKSLKYELGDSLKILSLTCVLLALW